MNDLVKAGTGEYEDDITLEEIEEFLLNVFTRKIPTGSIHGFRSCKNYGLIDMNTYFHCGDPSCENCNFFKDFLDNNVDDEHSEDS